MGKFFRHLATITKHRHQVIRNAYRLGIFFHALKHDLSKYGHKELFLSAKYYVGTRSPVSEERRHKDYYSAICQHHTKRNPHHWEYWTDFYNGSILMKAIPYVYCLEYVADVVAASKVYNKDSFTGDLPLTYFRERKSHYYLHSASSEFIEWCLNEYAAHGWKALKKKTTKETYEALMKGKKDVEWAKAERTDERLLPLGDEKGD